MADPVVLAPAGSTAKVIGYNGALWAVGVGGQGSTTQPIVSKSIDNGASWTVQDAGNSSTNSGGNSLPQSVVVDYDPSTQKVWFGWINILSGVLASEWFEFQTFDLNTGLYSATFGSQGLTAGLSAYDSAFYFGAGYARTPVLMRIVGDGNVMVFYRGYDPNVSNTSNAQLYVALYNIGGDTWPIGSSPVLVSDNCPTGLGNLHVAIDCLNAVCDSGVAYVFYQLVESNVTATPFPFTLAIYYRTVDTLGNLTAVQTLMDPQMILQDVGSTSDLPILTLRPMPNFHAVSNGFFGTEPFLSFQTMYVRGGNWYTGIIYQPSSIPQPYVLSGALSATPAFTFTAILSIANLVEFNLFPSGSQDMALIVTQDVPAITVFLPSDQPTIIQVRQQGQTISFTSRDSGSFTALQQVFTESSGNGIETPVPALVAGVVAQVAWLQFDQARSYNLPFTPAPVSTVINLPITLRGVKRRPILGGDCK